MESTGMCYVLLCAYWLLFVTASIVFMIVHVCDIKLPQLIQDVVLFGKMKAKKRKWTIVQWFEVPKSWFTHFYIIGAVVNGYMSYQCINSYIYGRESSAWVTYMLQQLKTSHNQGTTEAGSALLLVVLMFVQCCRRLIECLFISVFSKSTINIVHYIMGISLYTLFPLVVLCEGSGLQTVRIDSVKDEVLKVRHVIGIVMFLFASWQQHLIHRQFAALRKDRQGNIKTLQHKIPHGGWFEWVSCPHYMMEFIIYLSFIVLSEATHIGLWAVFLFVISNQLLSALLAHSWYKATYKDYPLNRKALIPYLL